MATQADVRRVALSLPGTEEAPDRFAFSVRNKDKLKGFVWVWMERVTPKPRVPQPNVIAVRVASLNDKDVLLDMEPDKSARKGESRHCVRKFNGRLMACRQPLTRQAGW